MVVERHPAIYCLLALYKSRGETPPRKCRVVKCAKPFIHSFIHLLQEHMVGSDSAHIHVHVYTNAHKHTHTHTLISCDSTLPVTQSPTAHSSCYNTHTTRRETTTSPHTRSVRVVTIFPLLLTHSLSNTITQPYHSPMGACL